MHPPEQHREAGDIEARGSKAHSLYAAVLGATQPEQHPLNPELDSSYSMEDKGLCAFL